MHKKMTSQIAEYYGPDFYISKKMVTWEIQYITNRYIEKGKQGCYTKSYS